MTAHGDALKRKRSELDSNDNQDNAPTATVLLALPMLVSHPPDHPMHVPGLRASLKALRRCTGITSVNDSTEDQDLARKRAKNDDGGRTLMGETMTPEVEVRAWMALAEIGMMVLNARCSRWGENDEAKWQWTIGVEQDIDTALLKGLALATSLPSLRAYKDPLTLLSARAATPKRAIKILTTMLASTSSFPPTKHTYEAYLALADLHLYPPNGGGKLNLGAGLHVLQQMRARAEGVGDAAVTHLATVAMLRARVVFCTEGIVEDVGSEKLEESLRKAEAELGITSAQSSATQSDGAEQEKMDKTQGTKTVMGDVSNRTQPSNNLTSSSSPFIPAQPSTALPSKPYPPTPHQSSTPAVPPSVPTDSEPSYIQHLRAHVLFLGITLFTYLGNAESTAKRVARVHVILDSGLLEYESEVCFCGMRTGEEKCGGARSRKEAPTVDKLGAQEEEEEEMPDTCPCTRSFVLPIPLGGGDKLMVRTTHPRVMFELAFLVSSVSRRDVVGRKPRRLVFAAEGLRASEEMGIDVAFPVWATLQDMKRTELQLAEIRADLLCELVAISTMRSEFDRLAELVAHARNFGLFETLAARIALHHAHFAHARGREGRAISCYEATIKSSPPGSYIHTSARASLLALQLGISIRKRQLVPPNAPPAPSPPIDPTIIAACTHSLSPLAHILRTPGLPIVRAKEQLKLALDGATRAQDNYTRALIVAMSASHYMHTAETHAGTMLGTVKQLAAGMGAVEKGKEGESGKKGSGSVGNAPLGLWVGLRLSELYKRAGDADQAKKQDAKNKRLLKAVTEIGEGA
ncbi:hypothetical protein FRC12_011218 [Ceratobasidium sp. 428]|nr:hypothetical protein FRC12_011218 [Ceratobasidium sp. 428]